MAQLKIVAFLQPGWADWESGPVLSLLRKYLKAEVRVVSPDSKPVTSIGGVLAQVQGRFSDIGVDDADAFLAIGSDAWIPYRDRALFDLLVSAAAKERVVGVICGATIAGARSGLFAGRAHTGNSREQLQKEAPHYAGAEGYVETPKAVVAGRVVSAPASAPQTFAAEVARLLAPDQAKMIDGYLKLCAAEFTASPTGGG